MRSTSRKGGGYLQDFTEWVGGWVLAWDSRDGGRAVRCHPSVLSDTMNQYAINVLLKKTTTRARCLR